ncbi:MULTISPECIES: CdaR family transcriptional regulator [unclassified Mycolicibacterium]|uniref:Rv1453 family transcriptional regulator n=1 Tax=unclassified Mycolicibacterium TaxID=2636767 RepID=UPI0012DC8F5F|nr:MULTISPECIES: PucR family transcriptional regulator [unclassified Mycolicibacterium]MUL85065.1 PucR family transcriptional regulator [Mycolicibacterium sp. CBMA 329]MUL91032.1 PucR family transcriptional regulator [Mycolicibacterium sp. CBMA 331]MUL98297.1 PucR family transcriptional regulator [Mycolicibacterium sp. CBMA 334]MUM29806.1 PucR family transcriptional regulator [Mycolicibacterium sp. CBMA 295]MUM40791.1 PucR family transcriptional regulator [Mycolicibacterium sp. CBMA 247]
MAWTPPSPRVKELIRQCAQIVVNARPEWLEELDQAVLAASPSVAADPELAAAVSSSNRANLFFWGAANVRDPGAPVPPNTGPEPLTIARELVRRGIDAIALDAYRVGEGVAWRRLLEIAFELSSDPAELHELLDVCSRSISAFVDATLAGIAAQIDLERDELTRGTHAERRETVALLLDGAPIPRQRAEARLGYALTGTHTAAVIWSEDSTGDLSGLDRAAEAFGQACGDPRLLSVLASSATRWVWAASADIQDGFEALTRASRAFSGVRIAIGPTADGLDGFRRSHFDAITTQQMMARLHSTQQIGRFTDVELVALTTADPDRAAEFVSHNLGALEAADTELQETVRVFVNEQCNASRAAARLYLHRNTLLRRLARADELLPRPLAENSVAVAVALDVLRWHGNRPG